jgi:predicted TIM-barrel fold metal-dependent hydrolase
MKTGIVDAHVHVYPATVAADPAAWGNAHCEPGWVACVAPEGKRSIQGWADPEATIARMDAAGVDACVMLGWYWERLENCELQNEWHADWIRKFPGRLYAFAAAQPSAGLKGVEALERALDAGLSGVGEMLPQAQGFTLRNPWWRRMVELAIKRRVPITLHATDPGKVPAAGPRTPLASFIRLGREYPEAMIILAHWGGGLAFRGAPGGEPLPPNLYFDTAASPLLYGAGTFRRAIEKVGPERIIYGSDFPLMLHPRVSREPGFGRFLGEIGAEGLNSSERTRVLGSNIRRILSQVLQQ